MRDLETIEIAIRTAETGHPGFRHSAYQYRRQHGGPDHWTRFRPTGRNQIRTMLGQFAQGVVAQTLCKRKSKGRVAALEVLIATARSPQ